MANNNNEARMIVLGREVREDIMKMEKEFLSALPSSIAIKLFMRATLTAVNNDPWLLQADRRSLLGAATKAAQDGLLPDGREGAFVVYNAKAPKERKTDTDVWIKKVQWMPMVYGIIKKMRNSGELSMLTARVVYGGDKFRYWIDDKGEHLEYEPADEPDTNIIRRIFAMAITKDGSVYAEPMTTQEVEKVRASSKAKDSGPWKDWWEEMAKKTAIRRLSKRMPMSTEVDQVLRRDDNLYDMRGHNSVPSFVPVENPLRDPVEKPDTKVIEHEQANNSEDAAAPWEAAQDDESTAGEPRSVVGSINEAARVIDETGKMVKDSGVDKPEPIFDQRFEPSDAYFNTFDEWIEACTDAEFQTMFSPSSGLPVETRRKEPERQASDSVEKIDMFAQGSEKATEDRKLDPVASQPASAKPAPAAFSRAKAASDTAPYQNAGEYLAYMRSFFEHATSEVKVNEEWGSTRADRNELLDSATLDQLGKEKTSTLKRIRTKNEK